MGYRKVTCALKLVGFHYNIPRRNSWLFTTQRTGRFHEQAFKVYRKIPDSKISEGRYNKKHWYNYTRKNNQPHQNLGRNEQNLPQIRNINGQMAYKKCPKSLIIRDFKSTMRDHLIPERLLVHVKKEQPER